MTANYKLILLFVSLFAIACNSEKMSPDTDGNCPEMELSMVFNLTGYSFLADVFINGHSYQQGPVDTKIRAVALAPTTLGFTFTMNDDTGCPMELALSPLMLSGESDHVVFDDEVTLTLKRDSLTKEYQANVSGDIISNSFNVFVLGLYLGEILLTWNDGESSNTLHITKFCVLPQPESPAD